MNLCDFLKQGRCIMDKKILVLATNNSTKDAMYEYLYNIFKEYIHIESNLVNTLSKEEENEYDLIIFPNEPTERTSKRYLNNEKIVFCHRTFDYKGIHEIFSLEPNSDVYFVNDNKYVVAESMKQLNDMGVIYFNLIPFYPGCIPDPKIVNAITPGEAQYAPDHVEKIIDLGSRVPSISDVSEIAQKLNLPIKTINSVTQEYLKSFANITRNSYVQLKKLFKTQQILKNVFDNIDEGVCLINGKGTIKMFNEKFCNILCILDRNVIDKNIQNIFKDQNIDFQLDEIIKDDKMIKNKNGEEVLISNYELHGLKEKSYLVYANYTETINKKEFIVRKKSRSKGILKKYSFDDYITNNPSMKKIINRAKKISHKNASVLIQGESGTGKEIIAQSIHYESSRKNYPFIPVNFAAIQPSLLDSELFGYVEGSFTGAIKGGSKGLIEMAHNGTIFFDEIGDAPLSFQVRLLRVLQEKEIRRVGSSERIPVDVRFIAATNKNLLDMVEKGRFREDLFYRINVMPIDTIPLRERKDDIRIILNHFIKEYFNDSDITIEDICKDEVINFLKNYDFKGNVRELINLVEYFSCIKGEDKIELDELPKYMKTIDLNSSKQITDYEYDILTIINENPKIGRGKIYSLLKEKHYDITEGKIRTILKKVYNEKYIIINNTRGGCEITYEGKILLDNMSKNNY